MLNAKTLAVLAEFDKQRLDVYLTNQLPEVSRSQVKKLIERGFVTVNGEKPSVHQFLKTGDTVMISEVAKNEKPLPPIEVLAETPDYVVINKPAGLLVHPTGTVHTELTLVDWLREHVPSIGEVGDAERPGLVQRLDRDTSGCMVIAKTDAMYADLKKQFADRKVKKTYIALVHGRIKQYDGVIDQPIGRSRSMGRMAVRPQEAFETDKAAVTKFVVIKNFRKPFTLVNAFPLTGRTHQIRAHFMAYGYPVVGDQVYTVKKQPIKIKLGRHFLHATQLEFTDLQGQPVVVTSPLPPELETYLSTLV